MMYYEPSATAPGDAAADLRPAPHPWTGDPGTIGPRPRGPFRATSRLAGREDGDTAPSFERRIMKDSPSRDRVVRHVGQRSLTARAREAILESIMEDRFEGRRIPPEKDLADMLGVSRTTVRSALQSLQDAGVIVRTRGRGTVVRKHAHPSTLALHRLVGFDALLRETGMVPSVESHADVTEEVPTEIAEVLGIEPDERCYRFQRLFYADGKPAIYIVHTSPVELLRPGFDPNEDFPDWFAFNDIHGKQRVDHAVVDILAEAAEGETAERLDLAAGTPIIVLNETHYSEDNEPLAYSQIWVNQEYVTFQVLRTN